MLTMSPLTQLYGINGLKTSTPKPNEMNHREENWINNFQKYHALNTEQENKSKTTQQTNDKIHKKSLKPINNHHHYQDVENNCNNNHREEEEEYSSRRVDDSTIQSRDLLIHGCYSLTSNQLEIYNAFVQMISNFDPVEMVKSYIFFCFF
jgi:hypothetical protein